MKSLFRSLALIGVLSAVNVTIGQAGGTASMTIQVNQPGVVISSNLFGIFFEEISMAGDGGIYAELVRNRSFEDDTNTPVNWSLATNGTATGSISLATATPMSALNPHYLTLTKSGGSGGAGAANEGYFGIPVTNGAAYNLEFYAKKQSGFSGDMTVSLESADGGTVYAQATFSGLTTSWQHFTNSLVSTDTDAGARLVARINQDGSVDLDFVSLFPADTYNHRVNGLRPDLMQKLVDLQPSFMRFPGGSWVDGTSLSNAYHWKPTTGFLPDRTPRWNLWGYMVNNGLGYHEYLQMCEDLGTEPLFDVNAGMTGGGNVSTNDLGPWVQEALDAIEYANGDTNTTYGAMRAANGHPAPFNLKYIEIGNENGGSVYNANYALFYDAIKSNYPSMHIIANNWGGIPSSRPVEIQDDHFYNSATWFAQNATKYDSYSRTGPKIFVGEYAVAYRVGPGFGATLNNALGEAAFMTGLERNSDIVEMACYAPLFANRNLLSWTPDLIYFDGTRVCGTPSYYVQKMFAENRGKIVLPTAVAVTAYSTNAMPHGGIGLGSWSTAVQFTNIVVTSNGVTLYQSDFAANGADGWGDSQGVWSVTNGVYQQTSTSFAPSTSTAGSSGWANYTVSLKARRTGGSEGFLVYFNWLDDNNWVRWNVGGWGNTLSAVQQMRAGVSTTSTQISQTITNNAWYDVSIQLDGTNVSCYLNGALVQQVAIAPLATNSTTAYATSSLIPSSGEIIVKAVNPSFSDVATTFNFPGVGGVASNATCALLTCGSGGLSGDINSLSQPTFVQPVNLAITNAGTNFTFTLPAYSLAILRLQATNIDNVTNLVLDVPSPMSDKQYVKCAVTGQLPSGETVDLTTNSSYGITYSSSDAGVATVDANGYVTGIAAGAANIVATYPALGLSATQTVQVVSAPVALVHRYSFSENSGTNVADSVGGPAWDGTLPNGGTFNGSGQLILTSASSQYVNLPAGILTNYSAVTIDTWATFETLPGACFLFGFGDKNGSDGVDYIFCQPKVGRIAITDANWNGEQGITSGGDWSGRTVHVAAVFDPPRGTLALYTNGVLVAQNTGVTKPMSVVNNVFSYIGRSLYSGDSYMNVTLDEFRIYNGALTAGDIASTESLGPDQLPAAPVPQADASLSIQVNQPGATVSSNLFGIFFEEINYGGDGGLYAELVRNRSFANSTSPDFWTLVTQGSATGTWAIDESQPLNTNNLRSLKLTMSSGAGSVGAANSGYWGIALQSNATYDVSLYVRATNGFTGPVSVQLQSSDGSSLYAQTSFSGLTTNWQYFAASLVSSNTDTGARIVVGITNVGTVWLDEVSLFPHDTFAGRTNGLRKDLASKLDDLHPSFYRYPGGNFIESFNVTNAVRWKKTIGDVATRPGHLNDSWGYWSTDGYGLDEFFRQCEDMHMEPLYGINAGLMLGYNGNTNNTVPLDQMGPWVQDALDLIEYANGDTNTTWGAVRAANGHPAPYHLKYMEIGNENGGSYYNDRYTLFYDAIKAKYPDIHLIACGNWSGGRPWSRPVEIMDEHYYSSPATFMSYATKYDTYDRNGPKVFVGEYAVTSGYGTYGNMAASLGEAAFMTGMERNSDIVAMACYAPLFANVNGTQWHPDLINFDNYRSFGTPAYYVQKMFSNNRGEAVLPNAVTLANATITNQNVGAVGVGTWNTSASYTNLVVTANGVTLYQSDFVGSGTNGWNVYNGTWNTNNGVYQQTSTGTTDCRSWTGNTNWANYTYSLRARKDGGSEGFLIIFNWRDSNNFMWWNLGGWGNTKHGVEYSQNGSKTTLASVSGSVTNGGWYDIRIELSSSNILCYLNDTLIHNIPNPTSATSLYVSTTYSKSSGQVIVKAVNPSAVPIATSINLAGVNTVATNATLIQMSSGSSADENSLVVSTNICSKTTQISNAGTNFTITLPAYSFSVLRLNASGINTYSNLLLLVPTPISSGGQQVASTVFGEISGNLSNLTANANHAITWSSSDPSVASVDVNGNVTGLKAGFATITASYAALDLLASQGVQVTNSSSAAELVHRYSFSETSGTNVADSIGGPVWDGWLPRGGAFNGSGRLAQSSALQQYVQLPAGILSNYTAVTIDIWASYGTLPSACFLYGFGNISGSTGYNYVFCQPKVGRIAITGASFSSEQNAYGNFDCSMRTNLHLTAVYNPPVGSIALYTNGVLAGINSGVTTPMSSVNDVYSYIGRSLYSGDSYFDFSLDEFRIYNGALTPADIAASEVLGPDAVLATNAPTVTPVVSGGSLALSWPVSSAGFGVEYRTNLVIGAWAPANVVPQIVGGQWQVTLPMDSREKYYRLLR